jgi:hypothetical protein
VTAWSFELPIDMPSKNGIPRHPHARKDLRNRWAAMLRVAARGSGMPLGERGPHLRGVGPPPNVPRRAVVIVRLMGKGQRAYDQHDGLEGGAVMLRDAMQVTRYRWRKGVAMPVGLVPGAGIVWDDSAAWSSWTYAQERAPDGVARTRIEVTDIEQPSPTPILDLATRAAADPAVLGALTANRKRSR